MTLTIIVLLYLVPVALLALLLAGAETRPRWLVVTAICCLPVFYGVHFLLLEKLQGWPSGAELPAAFELLAFTVEEPQPGANQAGHILIWARETDADSPRVHRLDYDRDLHENLSDAGERIASGTVQYGKRTTSVSDSGGATDRVIDGYRFSSQPPKSLPPKEHSDN
jgi:hypothetical protein